MFTILSAAELGFTAAKSATLMLNLELRVWKVCAFVFFIVESIFGFTTTIWLVKIVFFAPNTVSVLIAVLFVLPEVFSIICEFTIIRRRVFNIQAPEPTTWGNRIRKFVKYLGFVGGALLSIGFGLFIYWDRSSLGIFMTSLVLGCSLIVFGLSVFTRRRTTIRTSSAIFFIIFFSSFAVIRLYVRTEVFHPIDAYNAVVGLVLWQAAAGTFLVVLAAWRVPGSRTESHPDAATVDVLEIAVFGVTVPLVVLSAAGGEVAKIVILTILPQSMVIIGPICFAYFFDLVKRT